MSKSSVSSTNISFQEKVSTVSEKQSTKDFNDSFQTRGMDEFPLDEDITVKINFDNEKFVVFEEEMEDETLTINLNLTKESIP